MIRRRAVDDRDILGDRGGVGAGPDITRAIALLAGCVLAGSACGGGNGTADGSTSAGAAGADGNVSTGVGGSATTGAGGSATTGAGGSANSTCAVPARTPMLEDCTDFAPTGALIMPEQAVPGDGGIYLPGGELASPAGGTLIDGDYDLVRVVWTQTRRTQRTIRISNGGTFFEWVINQDDLQTAGATMHYRFNTTMSQSGTSLNVTAIGCSTDLSDTFGFTAAGDELDLFNLSSTNALFVYKRKCTRR